MRRRPAPALAGTAAIIRRGLAAGEIRSDLPAEVLAEYLLGLLRTRSWELADQPEAVRTIPSVVGLFLNGATGAPAGRPS